MHTFFEKRGWICDDFTEAEWVLKVDDKKPFDMYIIDINLPTLGGVELLKEIRKRHPNVPTIMVSAYTDIETIMDAYDAGCNEYIKKPFDLRELEIKVSKLINDELLDIGENIKYSISDRVLYVDDKEVHLSQKELTLLHTFMTNINRPLTHAYLESIVWNSLEDNGNALRNLILRLRKRIGKDIIETVQGKGYVLKLKKDI